MPLRLKDSEFTTMRDRAAEISPNALLRPVMQDYLLPTCSYVGGPAELAYLAQSQVIYDRLLGRMPVMISRAGFTLLEPHATKLLERYKLAVAQVFINEDRLKECVAHALVPASLEQSFDTETSGIMNHLGRVRAELERFDPTLAASLDKSQAKIAYQLDKARRKTAAEMMPSQRSRGERCSILKRLPLSASAFAGTVLFHPSLHRDARDGSSRESV